MYGKAKGHKNEQMIYFCVMLHYATHITALVLATLFLLKGSAPFFQLFHCSALKTYPVTETDNQGN